MKKNENNKPKNNEKIKLQIKYRNKKKSKLHIENKKKHI